MELLEDFSATGVIEEDGVKTYSLKNGPFYAGAFNSTIPREINVLPKPGRYSHRVYGTVVVTREKNQEFIDNFNSEVYQKLLPIDIEHELQLSGAVGYYEPGSGRVASDGSGWIGVRWEDRGIQALSEGRFYYFSPAWFDEWVDPLSKVRYKNVLVGGALTTNPYYKDKSLVPLYASEMKEASMADQDMKKCKECSEEYAEDAEAPHKCSETSPSKASESLSNNTTTSGNVTVTFTGFPNSTTLSLTPQSENSTMTEFDPKSFAEMQEKVAKFAELEAQLKIANETLARQAEATRKRHFTEIIRGVDAEGDGSKKFRGDVSVHATVLEALALQYGEDSEEFNAYVAEMRSLSEQLTASELLKNNGSTGKQAPTEGAGDAESKFFSAVAEYMKEHKVSEIEATNAIASSQPKLYREYRKASYAKNIEEDEE